MKVLSYCSDSSNIILFFERYKLFLSPPLVAVITGQEGNKILAVLDMMPTTGYQRSKIF